MNEATSDSLIHSFSRPLAEKYGVNAAILLGYIGNRIKTSKNIREGKAWFYGTIDELNERYPYLTHTPVHDAIKILTRNGGPLLKGNFNKWRNDKTTWYTFRDGRLARELESDLLYFKVSEASAYGLLGAVLLNNLAYWLTEKQKKGPDIHFHPMSPRKLEEVFKRAFSRNSISRALDHLVREGVLIPNVPTDPTKATEYRLAGPNDGLCVDTGGPIPDETEVAQNMVSGPIPNQAGPIPDLHGPDQNEGGPNPDKPGPNPNDNTILINSLEETHLKDESLKENHFKASSVVSASNSPGADASLTSSVHDSGRNDFFEPIASAAMVRFNVVQVNEAGVTKSFHELSQGHPHKNEPYYTFLDLDGVHKCCWEVMEFHNTNTDPIHQDMAEAIVAVAERLINQTDPAEIYRLLLIPSQAELNGNLYHWFFKFFSDFYDKNIVADPVDNAPLKEMFLSHSICFFNMAFHSLKFDYFHIYLGQHYHRIMQALFSRISPWIDAQKANKCAQDIKGREIRFASPDKDKEADPNLSAPEKMQVFLQSLQARNRIGKYDEFGRFSERVVESTQNTGNLARRFFQLNPAFTVQNINHVIDECVKLPAWSSEELDPVWHARNGYKISLLLNNLTQVATQLEMLSQIPPFTPLPIEDKLEV